MEWSAIGKRIRQQREYMGYTREQFAEQIDVTPKFCSDIETGAKGMSVPTLCRIAKTLRLSTDYILWGEDSKDDPDSIMMVLKNCSETERTYAEQLLKTFLAAMNTKNSKRDLPISRSFLLCGRTSFCSCAASAWPPLL